MIAYRSRFPRAAYLTLSIAFASPAAAQIPDYAPILFPHQSAAQVAREAFNDPYAHLIFKEFAGAVLKAARPSCLAANKLDEAKIIASAREIFIRYGTRSLEQMASLVDKRIFDQTFAALAGAKANDEFIKLKSDETVRTELRPIWRGELSTVVNFLTENLERFLLINKVQIPRFAMASTGKDHVVLAYPGLEAPNARQRLLDGPKSPQLVRYFELEGFAKEALSKAFNLQEFYSWRVVKFFEGAEKDLAALCIAVPG